MENPVLPTRSPRCPLGLGEHAPSLIEEVLQQGYLLTQHAQFHSERKRIHLIASSDASVREPVWLHPHPENATPDELRVVVEAAPNKRGHVRLSAMRALLPGYSWKQVCELNDWTDRMVPL